MSRLFALAGLAGALVACEHDEEPFEGQWWGVQCAAAPYGAQVYFPADERLDEGGSRREYVGNVLVNLDNTGLADAYVWQVHVDSGRGTADTIAFERAPFPGDFEAALDVAPLFFDAQTFVDNGTSADITGSCSWDGSPSDLFVQQVDDCDTCIDCSTVGGAVAGGPALIVLSGLLTRLRARRRDA